MSQIFERATHSYAGACAHAYRNGDCGSNWPLLHFDVVPGSASDWRDFACFRWGSWIGCRYCRRPVLGNLIAGLQIALTQPIRLDYVVIVAEEWGRIEEIHSSYVVVRLWDQRRLIVPLQWFIENPFQNWTRTNAQIIGSIFLWVDYRLPLEPLRDELVRLCNAAPEWDHRAQVLQVTDTSER